MKIIPILKHSWKYSTGLFALLVILLILYFYKFNCNDLRESIYDYLDPVASIMTFITTLVIYYVQASIKWENSLEKRLSVKYVYAGDQDKVIIEIVNAYLVSEADLRAWAQSLGQQIIGFLDFDMHWDESPSKIKYDENSKKYFKFYNVTIYLSKDPTLDSKKSKSIEDFILRHFKHSTITGDLNNLPITWKEIYLS